MKLIFKNEKNQTVKLACALGVAGAALALSAPASAQEAASSGSVSLGTSGAASSGGASAAAPSGGSYMERYKPENNLWEIGLFGGVMFPSSSHELIQEDKIGARYSAFKTAGEVGFRLAYFPLSFVGAEIEAAGMPSAEKIGGKAGLFAGRAHLIGQLPNYSVTPFVLVGMGGLGASSDTMGTDVDPAFHFGAGAKAALDEYLSVRLDLRDTMTQKYQASQGAQTHHPEVLLGLTLTLERRTPDSDGDGVADFRDRCPTVPGTEEGCPPAPKPAGAACPEAPAPAPAPAAAAPPADTDGDGILDSADRCPNEPAKTADGCPVKDSDGDGIDDASDKCPTEKETANGYKDDDGCPDELPAAVQKFSGVIKGIEFANNSAAIRPGSKPLLDDAAKVLKEYPDLKLLITGHTDDSGSKERNTELSRLRAEAVKKYLEEKGVEPARIEAKGMGPEQPIAPNTTEAGRQQNRRIEFKVTGK